MTNHIFAENLTKIRRQVETEEIRSESSLKKWDRYFLNICEVIATNSKCLSRQLGSVLTRDNIIISTGYNSPSRGIPPCDERCSLDKKLKEKIISKTGISPTDPKFVLGRCPRKLLGFKSGEGLEWCPAIHAEKNCLLAAARNGTCTKGTTIYLNSTVSPCTQCLGAIINAGVREVVLIENKIYDPTVDFLIDNSDVKIRTFTHI